MLLGRAVPVSVAYGVLPVYSYIYKIKIERTSSTFEVASPDSDLLPYPVCTESCCLRSPNIHFIAREEEKLSSRK